MPLIVVFLSMIVLLGVAHLISGEGAGGNGYADKFFFSPTLASNFFFQTLLQSKFFFSIVESKQIFFFKNKIIYVEIFVSLHMHITEHICSLCDSEMSRLKIN